MKLLSHLYTLHGSLRNRLPELGVPLERAFLRVLEDESHNVMIIRYVAEIARVISFRVGQQLQTQHHRGDVYLLYQIFPFAVGVLEIIHVHERSK